SPDCVARVRRREVIVYCSVGYRSEKIAEKLAGMGFGQVFNLYGGIFEWVNRGYPVYDEHGQTDNVHAYNHNWGLWLHKGNKVY
ncbi:MAG: rhodanese-like domain-containing protein, partial [Flavobacteriales bacterium]